MDDRTKQITKRMRSRKKLQFLQWEKINNGHSIEVTKHRWHNKETPDAY